MMDYDQQLLSSVEGTSDSVFQDGNQRLVYAICDIRETDTDYVVSFKPPGRAASDEISFDFLGSHLCISGECQPAFSVSVRAKSQPIEAWYAEGLLQLRLPKSACQRIAEEPQGVSHADVIEISGWRGNRNRLEVPV
ncbi:MAG: hypothetical protein HY075_00890 [Deltaproteobacteria bacterium]|nr:hypothetical protein [Deltaproteobacteria bacterium]